MTAETPTEVRADMLFPRVVEVAVAVEVAVVTEV
jgi:hypothetical protein